VPSEAWNYGILITVSDLYFNDLNYFIISMFVTCNPGTEVGKSKINVKIEIFVKIIKILQIFDHDEPSREKEAYITVRASDNGQPQLDDACTIKILIEDVNDNQPVFDKVVSNVTSKTPSVINL
jgi:hypothetical protein